MDGHGSTTQNKTTKRNKNATPYSPEILQEPLLVVDGNTSSACAAWLGLTPLSGKVRAWGLSRTEKKYKVRNRERSKTDEKAERGRAEKSEESNEE